LADENFDTLPPGVEIATDPVIEAYKKDVDRTLLRENLKLTVEQRFQRFESFMRGIYEMRGAAGRRPPDDEDD
jgi:hypothetical protein